MELILNLMTVDSAKLFAVFLAAAAIKNKAAWYVLVLFAASELIRPALFFIDSGTSLGMFSFGFKSLLFATASIYLYNGNKIGRSIAYCILALSLTYAFGSLDYFLYKYNIVSTPDTAFFVAFRYIIHLLDIVLIYLLIKGRINDGIRNINNFINSIKAKYNRGASLCSCFIRSHTKGIQGHIKW